MNCRPLPHLHSPPAVSPRPLHACPICPCPPSTLSRAWSHSSHVLPCRHALLTPDSSLSPGALSQGSCTSALSHTPPERPRFCTLTCVPWGTTVYSSSPIWLKSHCIILAPGTSAHPCLCRKPWFTTGASHSSTPRGSSAPHVHPTCTLFLLVLFLQTPTSSCSLLPIPTFSRRSGVHVCLRGPLALMQQYHNSKHYAAFGRCQALS